MKWKTYITIIIICLFLFINTSCGILHSAKKVDGYYVDHFYSCGPQAIHNAIQHYAQVNGIKFKRSYTAEEISKRIQDIASRRGLLSLVDKRAITITWPYEIEQVCELYGFKAVRVNDISKIKDNNTSIVLIHEKNTLSSYHWTCYPVSNLKYYGDDTIIDLVYLLIPLE